MILTGTLVNAFAIIIGSLIGIRFQGIPNRMKESIMQGIAICVIVIGLQMALDSDNILLVIISIVIGTLLGEYWRLEDGLNGWGNRVEKRWNTHFGQSEITQGFITATLLYCVGSMAILGAMQGGLSQDHHLLYTKSILDGITSILLSSTLGIGVLLSAFPVLIYQGSIAILAFIFGTWLPTNLEAGIITGITNVGGIMIIALGSNMLGVSKVRVSNMLPALLFIALFQVILEMFPIFSK